LVEIAARWSTIAPGNRFGRKNSSTDVQQNHQTVTPSASRSPFLYFLSLLVITVCLFSLYRTSYLMLSISASADNQKTKIIDRISALLMDGFVIFQRTYMMCYCNEFLTLILGLKLRLARNEDCKRCGWLHVSKFLLIVSYTDLVH
jgi:hypothetical protein